MSYHKKGRKQRLEAIIDGQIGRLVIPIKTDCCALARNWPSPSARLSR